MQAAAAYLYDAECALHAAHQSGVDDWIDAASRKLHEAVGAYLDAAGAGAVRSGRRHDPVREGVNAPTAFDRAGLMSIRQGDPGVDGPRREPPQARVVAIELPQRSRASSPELTRTVSARPFDMTVRDGTRIRLGARSRDYGRQK